MGEGEWGFSVAEYSKLKSPSGGLLACLCFILAIDSVSQLVPDNH
jgi:hypothetical protein